MPELASALGTFLKKSEPIAGRVFETRAAAWLQGLSFLLAVPGFAPRAPGLVLRHAARRRFPNPN
jgi:hypothetical protein